jgi:hypothetical protein
MRPQAKPFTVEKKKTKKLWTRVQAFLGLDDKSKTPEPVGRSVSLAAADRVFGGRGDPSSGSPAYSAQDGALLTPTGTPEELGPTGPVEPTRPANRILPDLSAHDRMNGEKDEKVTMASKPRRSRIREKDRTELKTERRLRRGTRRETVEPSAVELAAKELVDELDEIAAPSPNASPGEEPSGQRSVRLRGRPRLSAREIRRAVARGAIKITVGSGRNRKRR